MQSIAIALQVSGSSHGATAHLDETVMPMTAERQLSSG
jgi:hypothetical protein